MFFFIICGFNINYIFYFCRCFGGFIIWLFLVIIIVGLVWWVSEGLLRVVFGLLIGLLGFMGDVVVGLWLVVFGFLGFDFVIFDGLVFG